MQPRLTRRGTRTCQSVSPGDGSVSFRSAPAAPFFAQIKLSRTKGGSGKRVGNRVAAVALNQDNGAPWEAASHYRELLRPDTMLSRGGADGQRQRLCNGRYPRHHPSTPFSSSDFPLPFPPPSSTFSSSFRSSLRPYPPPRSRGRDQNTRRETTTGDVKQFTQIRVYTQLNFDFRM